MTGAEVGEQATGTFEVNDVPQAVLGVPALLHISKVDKWIVLGCIKSNNLALRQGRILCGKDLAEIGVVREKTVTIVHSIRAAQWQAFLVALPAESRTG